MVKLDNFLSNVYSEESSDNCVLLNMCRDDIATLPFPEAEDIKCNDPIHFLCEPLPPSMIASFRCGKSSLKFIHLNSLLPPISCPSNVRFIGRNRMKPGLLDIPLANNDVSLFDLRSAMPRLRKAASSYRNIPSIIRSSKNSN